MLLPNPCRCLLGGVSALALIGCTAEPDADNASPAPSDGPDGVSRELSPESLEMVETAWLSVSADGAVYSTFLDPDGRYRDVRDGAVVYTGSWEQNAARELCFRPDQGAGGCWSHGAPGLDGVMQARSRAGRTIALKRISYTAPVPATEDQDGAQSEAQDLEANANSGSGG